MPEPAPKNDDKGDPTKLDLSKNPQFAQLTSLVTQLGKGIQGLQASLTTQATAIGGLTEALKKGTGGKPEDKKDPPAPPDADVDNMSQAQLATHIFKGVRGLMDGLKDELSKSIEAIQSSVETKDVKTQIEQMRAAHKDFDDWIPEIKDKMNAVQGLSLAEAYTLVRQGNPDKSKELDDKYVDLDKDKSKPNGSNGKQAFGGLLPTSRISDDVDDGDKKPMTSAQAAEAAWESVFGESPELAGPDNPD